MEMNVTRASKILKLMRSLTARLCAPPMFAASPSPHRTAPHLLLLLISRPRRLSTKDLTASSASAGSVL